MFLWVPYVLFPIYGALVTVSALGLQYGPAQHETPYLGNKPEILTETKSSNNLEHRLLYRV